MLSIATVVSMSSHAHTRTRTHTRARAHTRSLSPHVHVHSPFAHVSRCTPLSLLRGEQAQPKASPLVLLEGTNKIPHHEMWIRLARNIMVEDETLLQNVPHLDDDDPEKVRRLCVK